MTRIAYCIIGFCFSLVVSVNAQELELGKLRSADLQDVSEANTLEAPVIVLEHYRETFFKYDGLNGWKIITKVQERVKILTSEGKNFATQKVKIYKRDGSREEISGISGYSYKLENDRIVKSKLDKNSIYERKISEHWDEYSWTMPDVQVGSIIEWECTLTSPFWKIDDLKIQQDVPVAHYVAVIRTPSVFNFNRLKKGYFEVTPESEFKNRHEGTLMPQDTGFGKSGIHTRSATMSFTELVETYELDDIPALEKENFTNNPDNYRYTVVYELKSVQYASGEVKNYTSTWDDVARAIYDSELFGKKLEQTAFLNDEVTGIKRMGTDKTLMLKNSFEFVRDQFSWNGDYAKYVEDDLAKVYKRRSGNSAEINLILVAMLRACGINANPILVGTKENGIPLYPTLEGFNYVIAGAHIDGKLQLMDATEPYSLPNLLPERVYNWNGRLVRQNGTSEEIDLRPNLATRENLLLNYTVHDGGKVEGNLMKQYNSLDALEYRKKHKTQNLNDLQQSLANLYELDLVENLELQGIDDFAAPVVESYSFEIDHAYDKVGNSIYLSPLLFLNLKEIPFKAEKRNFPIDFPHPFAFNKRITIRLPEGYEVDHLPEQVNIALPENMGSFVYKINSQGRLLNLSLNFAINDCKIPQGYYSALKQLYTQRLTKENEKIVLTKTL